MACMYEERVVTRTENQQVQKVSIGRQLQRNKEDQQRILQQINSLSDKIKRAKDSIKNIKSDDFTDDEELQEKLKTAENARDEALREREMLRNNLIELQSRDIELQWQQKSQERVEMEERENRRERAFVAPAQPLILEAVPIPESNAKQNYVQPSSSRDVSDLDSGAAQMRNGTSGQSDTLPSTSRANSYPSYASNQAPSLARETSFVVTTERQVIEISGPTITEVKKDETDTECCSKKDVDCCIGCWIGIVSVCCILVAVFVLLSHLDKKLHGKV